MNSFFGCQFNYCPLVWMFHSRKNNTKINNVHERQLRLIYSNKRSPYEELLEKNGSVSFHQRNIQVLATEMYKVKNDLPPKIFSDLFCQREMNPHNLKNQHDFEKPFVRTVYHGSETISHFGPKIWDILPESIKIANSLNSFKKLIKKWVPQTCPCK